MSEDIYLTKKAAADALAQKLKQKDPRAPPGYEVQRLKTEGMLKAMSSAAKEGAGGKLPQGLEV